MKPMEGPVRSSRTAGRCRATTHSRGGTGTRSASGNGDTLVVETSGFRDDVWLDVNGAPLTSVAKMTERFRRLDYGSLEIEVTVDDPKAYTRPWTAAKIRQRLMPDDELIEFVCA